MTARSIRIIALVLGAVALLALIFAVRGCQSARTAKTEAKLATGQADASLKSGADAVNTIGNVMANQQAGDQITQENGNAIDHATGSNVAVHPDARAAGMQSLCRRASYRASHPQCLQHPPAR